MGAVGARPPLRAAVEAERTSAYRVGDLAVDGADLLALGFHEGPELGRVLRSLLDDVIEEPALYTREALLERAREELLRV